MGREPERLHNCLKGQRLYAIGDIHGRMDLLRNLHQAILDDAKDALACDLRVTLIYLGDYIDRGAQSKEAIDFLLVNRPRGIDHIFLRGNHEATLLNFLDDPEKLNAWRHYGGVETLHSYGVDVSILREMDGFERIHRSFKELIPADHLQFYQNLQMSTTFGDYFFAHAGVKPGVSLDHQKEEDLLWIRDEFLGSNKFHGKVIVHGHTPVERPEIGPNRINIDTGAYLSGNLTCLVLQGSEQKILNVAMR